MQVYVVIFLFATVKIANAREKSPRHSTLPLNSGVKSWCRALDIQQSLQETGCEDKVIANKACVGQCFSYYSPGTYPRKDLSDKRMKYCDMCKPSLKSWTKVSLNCPGTKHTQVDKLVEMIYDCTCQKCIKDVKNDWYSQRQSVKNNCTLIRNFLHSLLHFITINIHLYCFNEEK